MQYIAAGGATGTYAHALPDHWFELLIYKSVLVFTSR